MFGTLSPECGAGLTEEAWSSDRMAKNYVPIRSSRTNGILPTVFPEWISLVARKGIVIYVI